MGYVREDRQQSQFLFKVSSKNIRRKNPNLQIFLTIFSFFFRQKNPALPSTTQHGPLTRCQILEKINV